MAYVHLNIEGKDVPCQFTILAFRKYCDHFDLSLGEFHSHLALKAPFSYTDMAFFAHQTFCDLNGKEVAFSLDDFTTYAGEMPEKVANEISEAILEIKLMGKSFKERSEDSKKKKS